MCIRDRVGPIVELLNKLHQKGKIGAFGGSNWTLKRILEANQYAEEHHLIPFTVCSPSFSLAECIGDPWGGSVTISGEKNRDFRTWLKEDVYKRQVYKGGLGVTIDREGAILGQAPWIFLITALMFVILYVIYNKTKIGFNVKAVGNNELIAKTAGINPRKVKFLAFFIAGCFFGIAGLINLSYGTALSPAKNMGTMSAVSYTHLDVYKRQEQ